MARFPKESQETACVPGRWDTTFAHQIQHIRVLTFFIVSKCERKQMSVSGPRWKVGRNVGFSERVCRGREGVATQLDVSLVAV